jgi:hypothetical protein
MPVILKRNTTAKATWARDASNPVYTILVVEFLLLLVL